jgi:ParB/RepB/Spo0J family partition protein
VNGASAPDPCACPECKQLDRAHPREGVQLRLVPTSLGDRPEAAPLPDPDAPTVPAADVSAPKAALSRHALAAEAGEQPVASMTPTFLTIAQLDLSPFNCRTNEEDKAKVDAIARSIATRGLIHPLQVHPMKGSKKFGVFAGGRRYRAHKNLITAGELPPEHQIAVIVRDLAEVDLIEMSLSENLLRRDLRPYEEYAAVRRAQAKGHSAEQIADAIGQDLIWVRRALRLADLAEPIFTALSRGGITVEQAQAFAATDDKTCQLLAWNSVRGAAHSLPVDLKAATIRAALKIGDAELDRLMSFVGEADYRAAGGSWELDLFAGEAGDRGMLTDEGLLRTLAKAKLDEKRQALRRAIGRDVEFRPAPPAHPEYRGAEDHTLRIYPTEVNGAPTNLPAGDVVGVLKVTNAGEVDVTWWWESRKAKNAGAKKDAPKLSTAAAALPSAIIDPAGATAQAADAQIREELGGTRDTVQIFRSMRRSVLRAALIDDARGGGAAAQDLFTWSQCRLLLGDDWRLSGQIGVGAMRGQSADPGEAAGHLRAMPAQRVIDQAVREISVRPWMAEADLGKSFLEYRDESAAIRQLAAAIVAGLALERSVNADGYRLGVHDALAGELGLTNDEAMRRYWTPTAELLALFPRDNQLEIAEPFVEAAVFGTWQRLKAGELTPLVLRVVTGAATAVRRKLADAAATWVHPLLRFEPAAAPNPPTIAATTAEFEDAGR